jgi:hypothetical protein
LTDHALTKQTLRKQKARWSHWWALSAGS